MNSTGGTRRRATPANSTEIHVLSAASGYQPFSLQAGTALHETDETFAFAVAPNRNVFAIKKNNTATNSTEIHVLSASRGYFGFTLQTGSALHPTDQTFEFAVALVRDVFVLKKSNPGTNSTVVHALRH